MSSRISHTVGRTAAALQVSFIVIVPVVGAAQHLNRNPDIVVEVLQRKITTVRPRPHLLKFDDIRTIGFDDQGRLVVLDREANTIDIYSSAGVFLYSLQNRTDGNRRIVPLVFATSEDHTIASIDMFGQSLTVYSTTKRPPQFARSIDMPGQPTSICALGSDYFVHIGESDGAVYRVRSRGSVNLAFSVQMEKRAPAMQKFYYNANLFCIKSESLIVTFSPNFPLVEAYDPKGNLRWTRTLTHFASLPIVQTSATALEIPFKTTAANRIVSWFTVDSATIGFQYRRVQKIGDAQDPSQRPITVFLNAKNGQEVGSTTSLPLIAYATNHTAYVFNPHTGNVEGFSYSARRR